MRYDEGVTRGVLDLSGGDQEAAAKLWDAYFTKLVVLAKRKFGSVRLRDVDEEDVALSAMKSFCRGLADRKFDAVENRNDLWKLLVTITSRKATAKLRRHFARKRGAGKVRGESIFLGDAGERSEGIGGILGKEPTPELAEELAENCHLYLDRLDDETLRRIALLTLEGYRTEEIATRLGCVRRTVERKLERIRAIWSETSTEDQTE